MNLTCSCRCSNPSHVCLSANKKPGKIKFFDFMLLPFLDIPQYFEWCINSKKTTTRTYWMNWRWWFPFTVLDLPVWWWWWWWLVDLLSSRRFVSMFKEINKVLMWKKGCGADDDDDGDQHRFHQIIQKWMSTTKWCKLREREREKKRPIFFLSDRSDHHQIKERKNQTPLSVVFPLLSIFFSGNFYQKKDNEWIHRSLITHSPYGWWWSKDFCFSLKVYFFPFTSLLMMIVLSIANGQYYHRHLVNKRWWWWWKKTE